MMDEKVRLVANPTVIVLAEMKLMPDGLGELLEWVRGYRPECLPDDAPPSPADRMTLRNPPAPADPYALFPHGGEEPASVVGPRMLTHNELLVELAGRNCYHSYGEKAGRKTNAEYIANTQAGDIPHGSIMYHAKMTFFIAGISRRVSHELIRHYVGADRSEEGSPSQESTRYTFHPGHFAVPPKVHEDHHGVASFREDMQAAYTRYRGYIKAEESRYKTAHGKPPKGIDRKRIYEAAAGLLPMQACTSMVWTANPISLAKLFKERAHPGADREFERLAQKWKRIALERWPNLFCQPWMRT